MASGYPFLRICPGDGLSVSPAEGYRPCLHTSCLWAKGSLIYRLQHASSGGKQRIYPEASIARFILKDSLSGHRWQPSFYRILPLSQPGTKYSVHRTTNFPNRKLLRDWSIAMNIGEGHTDTDAFTQFNQPHACKPGDHSQTHAATSRLPSAHPQCRGAIIGLSDTNKPRTDAPGMLSNQVVP